MQEPQHVEQVRKLFTALLLVVGLESLIIVPLIWSLTKNLQNALVAGGVSLSIFLGLAFVAHSVRDKYNVLLPVAPTGKVSALQESIFRVPRGHMYMARLRREQRFATVIFSVVAVFILAPEIIEGIMAPKLAPRALIISGAVLFPILVGFGLNFRRLKKIYRKLDLWESMLEKSHGFQLSDQGVLIPGEYVGTPNGWFVANDKFDLLISWNDIASWEIIDHSKHKRAWHNLELNAVEPISGLRFVKFVWPKSVFHEHDRFRQALALHATCKVYVRT